MEQTIKTPMESLQLLGLQLPEPPQAIANYIPAMQIGNLIYTSGILPVQKGEILYKGEIDGFYNSIEFGQKAAQLCVLNALSIVHSMIGSIDNIVQVVKMTGYVNSAASFVEQPKIMNGASDLLVDIFGEKGRHVRSAIGVSELPLGASVEIEFIFQVQQ